jgi:hypothetical protein
VGDGLSEASQTKVRKLLLVFFAVLFAAILIHPEWDLPEVHDVKITSQRHQSHYPSERPIRPVLTGTTHPLMDVPFLVEWIPQSVSVVTSATHELLLMILRV